MMEFTGMAQLDQAFALVGSRREPVRGRPFRRQFAGSERAICAVPRFPDSVRHRGEEKF